MWCAVLLSFSSKFRPFLFGFFVRAHSRAKAELLCAEKRAVCGNMVCYTVQCTSSTAVLCRLLCTYVVEMEKGRVTRG